MIPNRLVLSALLSCQIIFILNDAKGQSRYQTIEANQIKCSITVEDTHWSKGKAAFVTIRLENLTEKDINFWARYDFYLTNRAREVTSRTYERVGDGYWSPAGMILKDGQLELVPNDLSKTILIKRTRKVTTSRFPNDEIHLRKGEVKQIQVNLTQFLWEDRMHSGWPDQQFFDLIPRGKYHLQFDISAKEMKVASNQIEVEVAYAGITYYPTHEFSREVNFG